MAGGPHSITSLDFAGGIAPPAPTPPAALPANPLDWPAGLLSRLKESFGPWDFGMPWGGMFGSWGSPAAVGRDTDPDVYPGGWVGSTGTVIDRKGGRDVPLYWTEIDLRGFRVFSRWLWDTNPFMIGFGTRLVDYHVRKGFQWQACLKGQGKQAYATAEAAKESAKGRTVTKAQNVLDAWRDKYLWPLRSREGFRRLRRDGEFASRFGVAGRGELPWVRWVEPEQIGSPTGDSTQDTSFGRRNDPGDVETITHTFVRDPQGSGVEGEWVPESRLVFAKTNVDAKVKRGLPDSFSVHDYLDTSRKLVRNMVVVAAAQAAIAWREKFARASGQQVLGLISPTAAVNMQTPPWANGGQTIYSQKIAAGTVIRVEGDREFEPGPVNTGVASYIEAEQAALRAVCVRFGFPPYMTAKADDINFASSLTAGSPFALAVEGGQAEWAAVEKAVALKVLDLAVESGLLTPGERALLDVHVVEPAVTTPDPKADADRLLGLLREKVIDPYTAQQELGYDPSHIEANWKAWNERNAGQTPPGSVPPASPPPEPARESVVLENFTGTITDKAGHHRHYVNGKQVAAPPQADPDDSRPRVPHADDMTPAVLDALARDFPEAARDAGTWGKVKQFAGRLHERVYGVLVRATPYALSVAQELLDTPEDMKKLGFVPTVMGPTATADAAAHADPIRQATGLSTHLVLSLTSKVLAHGYVLAKHRLAAAEATETPEQVADWIGELLRAVGDALGVDVPVDPAAVLAAVKAVTNKE